MECERTQAANALCAIVGFYEAVHECYLIVEEAKHGDNPEHQVS